MKLTAKIGVIQLTDQRLRMLVVKTGGSTPKILESINEPLASLGTDPEVTRAEHVALIQQSIKRLKHTPTLFILNTPQAWSVMRLLSVPFKGAKKVRAALTFELEPYLAIPIENLAIDYLTVAEYEGQTEVFVMGLQKQHVAEQVALLNEAGVTIEGFGLDTVGLAALSLETVLKDSTPQALVLEHEGVSYLSIVRNRSLAYSQRLAATPAQSGAWCREVQNALRAFHATSLEPIELVKLTCMDVDIDAETLASLEAQLEMPIESNTLAQAWVPPAILREEDRTTWLSMAGAASSSAGASFNISFEHAELDTEKSQNPFTRHVLALVVLVLVVVVAQLGIMHLKTQKNNAEVERLGEAIWEEFSATYPKNELAKERPAGDVGGTLSFQAMNDGITDEQSKGTALTPEMFNQSSLPDMLKEVATYVPHTLASLELITVLPGYNRPIEITLKGDAKTPDMYGKIIDGLNSSPILTVYKNERSTVGGKLTFTITIRLSEEATESQ